MNQLCSTCQSKEICIINDFLKTNSDIISVSINECKKYNTAADNKTEAPTPVAGVTNFSPVVKEYHNFNAESKIEKAKITKKPIINFSEESEVCICPNCNGTAYEDEIFECAQCHTKICESCSITNPNTGKKICEKCWENN